MGTASATATVALTGHLMDTGILARVLDDVLEYGGDYRIESLELGREHEDESRALVAIRAGDAELLARILMRLQTHGANAVDPGTATTRPAPRDGVFPEDFYSTTNLDTFVRLDREWLPVDRAEMDCGLVVDRTDGRVVVRTVPVSDVRAGDEVVCGAQGVRVELPPAVARGAGGPLGLLAPRAPTRNPQRGLGPQIPHRWGGAKAPGRGGRGGGGPARGPPG